MKEVEMTSNRQEIRGKVQAVLGIVDAEELGITLTHEHVLTDISMWFLEPEEAGRKELAYEPVPTKNPSWLRHNPFYNLDNLKLLDEELAIRELMLFKKEGGCTVVDLSSVNVGRDPLGLARISRATGLNIIMGSGYYVGQAQGPDYDRKTEEEIAEEIISDIQVGVGNTGVHAGIIGEIGTSWPLQDREKKSLRAAARAQQRTGAAINVHPGRNINAPIEIIRLLDHAGADISRVVISHIDNSIHPFDIRCELAKTGCYLEYDLFSGIQEFSPVHFGVLAKPCDRERIEQIIELVDGGYLKQILLSQDICRKTKLFRYGGDGYGHILRTIVPQMLLRGMTREQIHTMLVENPKRMLQFVKVD